MKNKIKQISAATTAFAAFCVLFVAPSLCQAQTVGGYKEISKTDETVVVTAKFAVATQAKKGVSLKLISIERAERQVVAGANYRLCLAVNSNNKRQEARAVVYQNLQNKFSLTSWTAGKCAGAANQAGDNNSGDNESVSYKGALEVGKTDSTILYLGEESGDYAAFCFANNSKVGRAILAACKNGEQCEFVGKVDFESACKVNNLKANLSASGKITKIESVKSTARKTGQTAVKTAAVSTAAIAPDVIVKNLYAAQKNPQTSPFFQTKKRALVDKYFTKELADLLWKDVAGADGVGNLDFDPLYNAQDTRITAFKIGKPDYGEGNRQVADVAVTFKNMGKAETILFRLEQNAAKIWKIGDIYYPGNEKSNDSLKAILSR